MNTLYRQTAMLAAQPLTGNDSYFMIAFYLIMVVLVLALLFWVRKHLLRRTGAVQNGRYMRVIDRIVVAQDKQIVMLELHDRIAIVGITGQGIRLLLELPREAVCEFPLPENGGVPFHKILGDAMMDSLPFLKNKPSKEEKEE